MLRVAALRRPLRAVPCVRDGRPRRSFWEDIVEPLVVRSVLVSHEHGDLGAAIPVVPDLAVVGLRLLADHDAFAVDAMGPRRPLDPSRRGRDCGKQRLNLLECTFYLPAEWRGGHRKQDVRLRHHRAGRWPAAGRRCTLFVDIPQW